MVEYKQRTEEEWTQFPKTKVSSLTPAHCGYNGNVELQADKNPKACVDGLTTGCKYEFRVFAENRAGRGPCRYTDI